MYEEINEDISVIGIYKKHHFSPKKFKWNNRVFPVDEVTLSNDVRDGMIKKRLYSVVASGNLYRLEFNRESEQWKILEVWVD
ncbi:MAG: hypothetical protein HN846_04620 [Candidatus Pacebacteria bacterium]|jgi:hypothetical protein|nr:hypothetical protein [Candidatus Paceibacterota bacterium]MBT3512225.1 hypothetical protein [Candidatus Paceibacterota bacterium]MBT4004545.1 hypothetical protein [Candidatus Paceibacterota bacterium]MBT4359207.1 hypothetical protein [Candidatus Paceibacterota bacterium]MBT4681093.1 hypothetical protein [Candidatus Paceibacterota bacterium]